MLKKVTIYGERCSGTTYLENLLNMNFDIEIVWSYGWKHFFGFNNLSNSDDVLFIGIVRNVVDWVNSLYREKCHLSPKLTKDVNTFLNNPVYSYTDKNELIANDRNMYTNQVYRNIFELRHTKNNFLIETMPRLVKNYCLITYDDLMHDFVGVMNKIRCCNIPVKNNIEFPLNRIYYKHSSTETFKKKQNTIPREIILSKANMFYEKILFPNST